MKTKSERSWIKLSSASLTSCHCHCIILKSYYPIKLPINVLVFVDYKIHWDYCVYESGLPNTEVCVRRGKRRVRVVKAVW